MGLFGTAITAEEVTLVITVGSAIVYLAKLFSEYRYKIVSVEEENQRLQMQFDDLSKRYNAFVDSVAALKLVKAQ